MYIPGVREREIVFDPGFTDIGIKCPSNRASSILSARIPFMSTLRQLRLTVIFGCCIADTALTEGWRTSTKEELDVSSGVLSMPEKVLYNAKSLISGVSQALVIFNWILLVVT
jgi:hypothetical protein